MGGISFKINKRDVPNKRDSRALKTCFVPISQKNENFTKKYKFLNKLVCME